MDGLGTMWYRFSGCDPNEKQTEVSDTMHGDAFNDVDFYKSLWEEKDCQSVEISSVCVRHNQYCHGIQCTYRLTFADGKKAIRFGPENFSSSGYYAHTGRWKDTWIHLGEDEYIKGLRVRQGDIVNRITFVTNRREAHCGGLGGGVSVNMMAESPSSMRIVAFSGTMCGVYKRIGFYAKHFVWATLDTCILMRELVNQGRAVAKASIDRSALPITAPVLAQRQSTGKTMQELVSLDEDAFRHVMTFLIPSVTLWSRESVGNLASAPLRKRSLQNTLTSFSVTTGQTIG